MAVDCAALGALTLRPMTEGDLPMLHAWLNWCVFRKSVTARFGIVTAEFGNVTERFGDVTDGVLVTA